MIGEKLTAGFRRQILSVGSLHEASELILSGEVSVASEAQAYDPDGVANGDHILEINNIHIPMTE